MLCGLCGTSDYASLLPMTAMLHSGRAGMKGGGQFASQAIEPIGGGGPGGGAWTRKAAGRCTWRALCWHRVCAASLGQSGMLVSF